MQRGVVQYLILLLAGLGLAGFVYYGHIGQLPVPGDDTNTGNNERHEAGASLDTVLSDDAEHVVHTPEITQKEVLTSEPLEGPREAVTSAQLTNSGVLVFTNEHRADADLSPLTLNSQLNAAALLKARDMFDKQYFAHDSPTGEGAGDLAERAGYEYVSIGENLALGNYENDEALVQAWMDSPGHRENILQDRFTEIGIAVLKGVYEGHETWIAVQEFGLPTSACPGPSDVLAATIDKNKEELEDLGDELAERQEEIEDTEPKYGKRYNDKVRAYNELAHEYNDLLEETKALVSQYNEQVQDFNACASG